MSSTIQAGESAPHSRLEQGAQSEEGEPREVASVEEGDGPVNYDEPAQLEMEIDGTDYRLDVGRAGTALCISTRPTGNWSWVFRGEARWQLNTLRCKAFDREVLQRLSKALAETADSSQG
jgi:hypothetical protein